MLALVELCVKFQWFQVTNGHASINHVKNTKDVKYTRVSGWMGFLYPWGKFIIQVLITSSSFWKYISRVLINSLSYLPCK